MKYDSAGGYRCAHSRKAEPESGAIGEKESGTGVVDSYQTNGITVAMAGKPR